MIISRRISGRHEYFLPRSHQSIFPENVRSGPEPPEPRLDPGPPPHRGNLGRDSEPPRRIGGLRRRRHDERHPASALRPLPKSASPSGEGLHARPATPTPQLARPAPEHQPGDPAKSFIVTSRLVSSPSGHAAAVAQDFGGDAQSASDGDSESAVVAKLQDKRGEAGVDRGEFRQRDSFSAGSETGAESPFGGRFGPADAYGYNGGGGRGEDDDLVAADDERGAIEPGRSANAPDHFELEHVQQLEFRLERESRGERRPNALESGPGTD